MAQKQNPVTVHGLGANALQDMLTVMGGSTLQNSLASYVIIIRRTFDFSVTGRIIGRYILAGRHLQDKDSFIFIINHVTVVSSGSGAYPRDTGHEVGIHTGW